jgi:hypothetical protein
MTTSKTRKQVPHPGRTGIGGAQPGPRRAARFFFLAANRRPLPAWPGLQVQRPELVHAEDDLRLTGIRGDLTVGNRVQVLDPGLLGRVVRVLAGLPGFQPLKGDALLAQQHAQPLVADVVDHPLSDQELGQLRQTPGGKRQVMLGWAGLRDLLDLPPLGQRELRRAAALVPRIQRAEPISPEVADHIPDPVLAGECHLRDRAHVHALRRQQHHLRPPPGHHRPAAPAHNPHQPPAFVIVDLTHPQAFRHRPSVGDRHPPEKRPAGRTCYGTRHQRVRVKNVGPRCFGW